MAKEALKLAPGQSAMVNAGVSRERSRLNSIRLYSGDCVDESIKLFSNFGESLKLKRRNRDDFTWDKNGVFVAKNLSEQECTLQVEVVGCSGDFWVCRTSRGGSIMLKPGEKRGFKMPGITSLTFRSNDAMDPGFREHTNI
jgi:hypothetical protein